MAVDSNLDRLKSALANASGLNDKLQAIENSKLPAAFSHIAEPAQPLLCCLVASRVKGRLWIVCKNLRHQEVIFSESRNWHPEGHFFPELEMAAVENALVDPDISAERLDVLNQIQQNNDKRPVFLTAESLDEYVPSPKQIADSKITLTTDEDYGLETLAQQLSAAGFERNHQVAARGQFAVRGGIIDIFSWQHATPVRIEFFGDTIDSIREFDLDQQISIRRINRCDILLDESEAKAGTLRDYIQKGDLLVDLDCDLEDADISIFDNPAATEANDVDVAIFENEIGGFDAGDLVLREASRERFLDQIREWDDTGWQIFIVCNNEGEQERLRALLNEFKCPQEHITFLLGSMASGFAYPEAKLAVLSDSMLFGRYRTTGARRLAARQQRLLANRTQIDFSDLNEGELVVHLEHGIGKFKGLKSLPVSDSENQDVLEIEFDQEARLYVPLEQSYLVSRYVGVGKKSPKLSKLGDAKWSRARKSAEKAIFDYAAKLLAVHAERETAKGHAFSPDTKWQHEFEQSFLYKETPDQLAAIQAVKQDMESERPMDRLICGDVGFGKTEVAIRAAFKAVMDGKQVAILVPTTVLAQQHEQTLKERMSDYPFVIDGLTRFKTTKQQKKTLKAMREGTIDIVVGTHRLISKDVSFKNLGLVVIDEEQRFGVVHKEKFKTLFRLIDVLTLSATPIPRTLYLSLMGAKDMSTIETPPTNRLPVETVIAGYDERIIRDAIQRELHRQGQVYFLHNRVKTIENMRRKIEALVPQAKAEVGHGQMEEDQLESVMQRFVAGSIDILVSTTIIESGLDIPNANTIIIDRADRFGLADLYQLRGRVGRAQHKAYAFFLLPRDMMTVGEAKKRISAIKQYTSLGSGFKIAMRDLEIRGAGNILGTAQSGHIVAVGFDLYCQLLKQAVAKLKGEKVKPRTEVNIQLDFISTNEGEYQSADTDHIAPAFLPGQYIADSPTRIQAYRQFSAVENLNQLQQLEKQWKDRFGPPPAAVKTLLMMGQIKLLAARKKITKVETSDGKLMLTRGGSYIMVDGRFPRLTQETAELNVRHILKLLKKL